MWCRISKTSKMAKGFFEKINYSSSNEDSESERQALKLGPADVVLCITGSGARSLDLLVDAPKKVVSIDFNPTQNYLLALKIAAYKTFDYDEFAGFIGLKVSDHRLASFERLVPLLSQNALKFWRKHPKKIKKGILYIGTWEKYQRGMQKIFYKRRIVRKMMNAQTMAHQKEIWENEWKGIGWRMYLKLITSRTLWAKIVREPGARLIPKDFDLYAYLEQRLDFMVTQTDLKTNHYANLIFQGFYGKDCILPHHLRPENYELIKANVSKIEIVTDSLTDYLLTQKNKITAFSLSDFSSYAPKDIYEAIWKNVIAASAPNARFCERQFLVKRNPEKLFEEIKRNSALEAQLNKTDESAIYTFCVGSIY